MTIPNALSLFRLVATFFFIFFVTKEMFGFAFTIFLLQALSDLADGLIARRFGFKTLMGTYLDPIADKFMLLSTYLILTYKSMVPKWLTFIVLFKDFLILLGFFTLYNFSVRIVPNPRPLGKICTASQMVAIAYLLWAGTEGYVDYFFYATAICTVLSTFDYFFSGLFLYAKYRLNKG
ncbi:MAG: CDP-alcohol phosphatidyltransferase family protein [Desulfobacterota bacterium]|nr:CDP-alcohol phosphatidyltransferase family protein [Thermodesulfobacteriota bacterium]MDW8001630.1 CDP-alcohol phosphatidyltransferase family protein [Deltaproteobacteria bacterium]